MIYLKDAAGTLQTISEQACVIGREQQGQAAAAYDRQAWIPKGSSWAQGDLTYQTDGITNVLTAPLETMVQISRDNATWAACRVTGVNVDPVAGLVVKTIQVSMLVSPVRYGTFTRYPTSGYQWGAGSVSMSQAGLLSGKAQITVLPPTAMFPLVLDLASLDRAITFTRAAVKVHAGVSYAANIPVFDAGLYLASDTASDVGKVTLPTDTIRTVSMQIKKTNAAGGSALTVWTASKNKLTINLSTNLISWTDDTTTITATFPTTAWNAGTVIDVVVIDGASHAATLIVHAAGGTWYTGTGTLAAIAWPELTLGVLEGSLAWLTQFPYALASAEYQALAYSQAPWKFNNLSIPFKAVGTHVKGVDSSLTVAGQDKSGLVSGTDPMFGSSPTALAESGGISCRWYAELGTTNPVE